MSRSGNFASKLLLAGAVVLASMGWGAAASGAGPLVVSAPPASPVPSHGAWLSRAGVEPGVSDSVNRLYLAVFDRRPDQQGFDYWLDLYLGGTNLGIIAESFMASFEWGNTYGTVDDSAFVELLYLNVMDRSPDAAGQAYWLQELGRGMRRVDLLLAFSESTEFVRRTATAPPAAPPRPQPVFPALPDGSGRGRRIVYANRAQRVWLVDEQEKVVDSYLVSGRANVPAPGSYAVFSKSPVAYAGHHGITMKHMVRFAWGRSLAIGFHSIPRYSSGRPLQSTDQLGTFQSAGCVRQSDHKAEALYQWADIGTTVVVLP